MAYREPIADDMDLKAACRAHYGTSHTPDIRGRGEVQHYIGSINEFHAALLVFADTPEKVEFADEVTERYRVAFLAKNNAVLASRSNIMSPMITGPARFPVARNQKRMNAYEKRVGEFLDWSKRFQAAALRDIKKIGQPLPPVDPNKPTGTEAVEVNGVQIVKNHDLDRVQILFDGKPDPDTIKALKGSGWNWSPRNLAWQRKLTDAAFRSAQQIAA